VNQLEIALKEANGESVSLKLMTPDALESFMLVMSSLKAIAESLTIKDNLNFSISEGSAQCVLEAPQDSMEIIYEELDIAIKGESEDKDVTSNLRSIQDQIKRENYKYRFLYKRSNKPPIDLYSALFNSKRITVKRKRNQYEYKLKIKSGFFNQLGGNTPNYHFDYGGGEKITIGCTVNQAKKINQYIYSNIQALLLCKEWYAEDKKDEYTHKAVLDEEYVNHIKTYLNSYNKENELLRKLRLTHEFIDKMFNENKGHKILFYLLLAFNDKHFHLSELKTLLVISKSFREEDDIEKVRKALLETYEEKKNKLKK